MKVTSFEEQGTKRATSLSKSLSLSHFRNKLVMDNFTKGYRSIRVLNGSLPN